MKRSTVAAGRRSRRRILGLAGVALGLMVWIEGNRPSLAQEPSRRPVMEDPWGTLGAAPHVEAAGRASDEVWISSDAPAEAAAGPVPASSGGARSPLASRVARRISPDRAIESSGPSPSSSPWTLSGRLKAAQRELLADIRQQQVVPAPPNRGDDCLLFHTTSGPEKPAALVFRPAPQSRRDEAVPALREEDPAVSAQSSKPPEVALRGSIGWSGERPSGSILDAMGLKPPQVPLSASSVRSNALPVNSAVNAQVAAKSREAGAEAPLVRSNEPLAISRSDGEEIQTPTASTPEPVLPPVRAMETDSEAAAEKLVLRVRVAEFDRAGARKWSILGLKFSRRPPLLESLLQADSGVQPILLDSMEPDEVESQIGLLEQEGLLRVREQPALVTASGRQTMLLADGNRAGLASAAGGGPSSAQGDLPHGLTLRPVVLADDQIELEVTGPRSGIDFQESRDQTADPAAPTGSATVRMRSSQTVAIRGLGHLEPDAEEPRQRASLAKVLVLGKSGQKQGELVLFITPERIHSTPPAKTASLRRYDAAEPEKRSNWLNHWIAEH